MMTKLLPLLMIFVLCGCERAKQDNNCIVIEDRVNILGFNVPFGEDRRVCGIQNIPQLAALLRGELHDVQYNH